MSDDVERRNAVLSEFPWDAIGPAARIGVTTHDGAIALPSHVGRYAVRRAAERAFARGPGAEAIVETRVVRHDASFAHGDEAIAAAIVERLYPPTETRTAHRRPQE